jgi:hypothetical protein
VNDAAERAAGSSNANASDNAQQRELRGRRETPRCQRAITNEI